MDEWHFELAQLTTERAIENALHRVRTYRALTPKGKCFNCDEPFEPFSAKLFCDGDCRDDFERLIRRL